MSETRYTIDRAILEEIGKEISGAIIAGIAETVAAAIIERMSTDAQEAGTGAASWSREIDLSDNPAAADYLIALGLSEENEQALREIIEESEAGE